MPLLVESACASTSPQPVTAGVPFPKGTLKGPGALSLVAPGGRAVPLQASPLARWSDGSVKWLLLDAVLPETPQGQSRWLLRPGDAGPAPGLEVREGPGSVVVSTGPATFHLSRTGPFPFGRVVVDDEDLLDPASSGTLLTDAGGSQSAPRVEQMAVEDRGPVRATVRLEGTFPGRARLRVCARLSFFAGTGLVRINLTLHNPRRARHRGGLWDLGDPGSVLFRDLSLRLALERSAKPHVSWRAEVGQPPSPASAAGVEIYQDSSGGENWRSRNHVNREGKVPCSFRGYRLKVDGREERGLRASPVLSLGGAARTLSVAVPEFWQQFPKAVGVEGRVLRVGLFPGEFGDPFELQGGEQKTHTVWLDVGTRAGGVALDWVHQPARVHAPPEWYAGSGAVPFLGPPRAGPPSPLERFLTGAIEGADSLLARREVIDEYGWRHFGEVYADHERTYYPGAQPVISHYNNQYDVVYGALLQYFRTGDARWVDLFDPLARHVIDVDIYHTTEDKAAYSGGLFWHTDHYKDAATCTHRSYSRANQAPGRPYGGGPCDEHNYTTGLLHYYYLTGDHNARAAVLSLADWVVNMDDGRRNVLGLVDEGPTGWASGTAGRDYHGPGRGCGNSVNALLDAWLLTGRRRYLEKAEGLIRRCVHPLDDVASRDLLNVELRWSYTVFLAVLARFLLVKAEAGELDSMYAYAQASLTRYARWMLDNEAPYFDHPEKLEFPTETWAAQEFRKANVLRLAAAHAEEPLRARLLERADELAERGWADLLRFEHPATTRALAILLVEGVRDCGFRLPGSASAPGPPGGYEFGLPESFVPQRARVLARLKTFGGLTRALLKMASPRTWRRALGLVSRVPPKDADGDRHDPLTPA